MSNLKRDLCSARGAKSSDASGGNKSGMETKGMARRLSMLERGAAPCRRAKRQWPDDRLEMARTIVLGHQLMKLASPARQPFG